MELNSRTDDRMNGGGMNNGLAGSGKLSVLEPILVVPSGPECNHWS